LCLLLCRCSSFGSGGGDLVQKSKSTTRRVRRQGYDKFANTSVFYLLCSVVSLKGVVCFRFALSRV
jgi:hypothetical protein